MPWIMYIDRVGFNTYKSLYIGAFVKVGKYGRCIILWFRKLNCGVWNELLTPKKLKKLLRFE